VRWGLPVNDMSPLSQGRGLKLHTKNFTISVQVAPLAGAWIETKEALRLLQEHKVAPLAGAWIETDYNTRYYQRG